MSEDAVMRSRRVVITGGLAGLGALVAQALGRPLPAAATVDYVVLGGDNTTSTPTRITNTTGFGRAIEGVGEHMGIYGVADSGYGVFGSSDLATGTFGGSDSGTGVRGSSSAGTGVHGDSSSSTGVYGSSGSGYGIGGTSGSGTYAAMVGRSGGDNTGVHGHSGSDLDGDLPASPDRTGVYGYANQGTSSMGVFGDSPKGFGVIGNSSTGRGVAGGSDSGTGVHGFSGTGALPAGPAKTGVFGYSNQDGGAVAIRGESPTGRGGVLKGKLAQLRLAPSTAASHPQSGQKGDLFVDASARLWFCHGGATWTRLA